MQCKVVQPAIGEPVAVILGLFDAPDETVLGEVGDGLARARGAAAQVGGLLDDGGRDEFVVFGGVFDLRQRVRVGKTKPVR